MDRCRCPRGAHYLFTETELCGDCQFRYGCRTFRELRIQKEREAATKEFHEGLERFKAWAAVGPGGSEGEAEAGDAEAMNAQKVKPQASKPLRVRNVHPYESKKHLSLVRSFPTVKVKPKQETPNILLKAMKAQKVKPKHDTPKILLKAMKALKVKQKHETPKILMEAMMKVQNVNHKKPTPKILMKATKVKIQEK